MISLHSKEHIKAPIIGICRLTLKQTFRLATGVQPTAQLRAAVVGATVVIRASSASFLQIYFSLLLQLTTSHNPAKVPVAMATHPCFLPFLQYTIRGEKYSETVLRNGKTKISGLKKLKENICNNKWHTRTSFNYLPSCLTQHVLSVHSTYHFFLILNGSLHALSCSCVVYRTWHAHIEMCECNLSSCGPLESVYAVCVGKTSPEILLWS